MRFAAKAISHPFHGAKSSRPSSHRTTPAESASTRDYGGCYPFNPHPAAPTVSKPTHPLSGVVGTLMRSCFISRLALRVALVLGLLSLASLTGVAQMVSPSTGGAIAGTVADPTGAVIPNAAVRIQRDGQPSLSATSDGLGRFTITGLAPGVYAVTAQAPGFQIGSASSVRVTPGSSPADHPYPPHRRRAAAGRGQRRTPSTPAPTKTAAPSS